MHIFVINLPECTARREAIERQLQSLGLAYEIFPAVRGKLLTPEERRQHYDETWFVRNHGRAATPGEIGGALSHLAIYRLIGDRNIPHALILEDDAWLNPNLPHLLDAIEQAFPPQESTLLLLGWATRLSKGKLRRLWSSYKVVGVHSAMLAHAYVVSNAAAADLLRALYPVRHVPDPWVWVRRHGVVNLQAVIPPCVTVDLSYESAVDPGVPKPLPFARWLARKAYRAWWLAVDCAMAALRRLPGRGRAR